jgi:hypothetical protein
MALLFLFRSCAERPEFRSTTAVARAIGLNGLNVNGDVRDGTPSSTTVARQGQPRGSASKPLLLSSSFSKQVFNVNG